jgi:hypothetical protein
MKARKNSITSEEDVFKTNKSTLRKIYRQNKHIPSFHEIGSYKIDLPAIEIDKEELNEVKKGAYREGLLPFKKKMGVYCLH